MINRERLKSSGYMKLISVKIKWASQDSKEQDSSSESDFGNNKKQTDEMGKEKDAAIEETKQLVTGDSKKKPDLKLKFEYVSEVSPKISNFSGEKQKPSFIKVVSAANESPEEEGPTTFYIYTSVGNQSVVFKRKWEDVSPPEQEENVSSDEPSDQNRSKISNDSGMKGDGMDNPITSE